MKSLCAFTLIELLVSISIIGILVSILLPSIHKAREKTKSTVCLNNIAQLGKAAHSYATDDNYKFPPPGQLSNSPRFYSLSENIAEILTLYNSDRSGDGTVYHCPSNNKAPRGVSSSQGLWLIDQYSLMIYVDNFNVTYNGSHSFNQNGAAKTLFTEHLTWWVNMDYTWGSNHSNSEVFSSWNSLKASPAGFNQGYVDGSARWHHIGAVDINSPMVKRQDQWIYYVE